MYFKFSLFFALIFVSVIGTIEAAMPFTKATEDAVVQFNRLTAGHYGSAQIEEFKKFLSQLEVEASKDLNAKSTTLNAIEAIHNAELRLGNIEYKGNANIIQPANSKKIQLDCNMQSIVYLMTLESLGLRFPNIKPDEVFLQATLDHAFLEVQTASGPKTVEVAHTDRFAVMDSFLRPPSYNQSRSLQGRTITSNMLLDFANDISDPEIKIEVLKAAAALDPEDINARYNLASMYQTKGDYANALKYMSEAVNLGPAYEHLYLKRAIIKINASQLFSGVINQRKIIIENDNKDAQRPDIDSKVDAFVKKANDEKKDSSPDAAFREKNKTKIDDILADFNAALAANPYFIDAYLNRAIFYAMIGDLQKSADDYAKVDTLLTDALKNIMTNGLNPALAANNPFQGSSFVVAPDPQQVFEEYNRMRGAATKLASRLKTDAIQHGKDLSLTEQCRDSALTALEQQLAEIAQAPKITTAQLPERKATKIHYYDLPSAVETLDPESRAIDDSNSTPSLNDLMRGVDLPKLFKGLNIRLGTENHFQNNLSP